MTAGAAILWAFAALVVGAAAATAARVLRGLARVDVEEYCRRRRCEHLLREILDGAGRTATGAECLQAIAAALFVAATAVGIVVRDAATEAGISGWTFTLIVLVGAAGLWIANVTVPAAFAAGTTGFVIRSWAFWRIATRLLFPLIYAAEQAGRLTARFAGRTSSPTAEPSLEADLRGIVTDEQREAALEEDAREMIEGVIQLGDAEVAQVMTPRTYMFSMHASLSFNEMVKFVISSGHTRVPVYDKNRDDIVGILHMKDLLPELVKPAEQRTKSFVDLLRPAPFVPESKRLDELLQEFQHTRNHMAIVLDEYGGVSGVVTLEDVLEEIVGEIVDEYDDDLGEEIKTTGERTAEVLARVHINAINERLGIHLPEDGEFDTIGGFVFSHLGHIPAVGETVTVDDVRLTVIDVTRRRIERVRIEVLDPSAREIA